MCEIRSPEPPDFGQIQISDIHRTWLKLYVSKKFTRSAVGTAPILLGFPPTVVSEVMGSPNLLARSIFFSTLPTTAAGGATAELPNLAARMAARSASLSSLIGFSALTKMTTV